MPNELLPLIELMGYENRDYFRDGSYTSSGSGVLGDAPVCKRIIIVTAVVFVLQMFLTRPTTLADFEFALPASEDASKAEIAELLQSVGMGTRISMVEEWFELDTRKVLFGGQVWRLVTCTFLHDRFGIWHIVMNMLVLFFFGRDVEWRYGGREFLLFYLLAAVSSSILFVAIDWATTDPAVAAYSRAMGASGAVMGVFCLFVMWNPRSPIRIWFLFPIEARILLLLYVIYDLHPVFLQLSGTPIQTGVAHAGHLGGLLMGFAYFRQNWQLSSYVNAIVARLPNGKRPRLKIHRPKPPAYNDVDELDEKQTFKTPAEEKFDAEIDAILEKISQHGEASLTDKERKQLVRGSQRYRNRS